MRVQVPPSTPFSKKTPSEASFLLRSTTMGRAGGGGWLEDTNLYLSGLDRVWGSEIRHMDDKRAVVDAKAFAAVVSMKPTPSSLRSCSLFGQDPG